METGKGYRFSGDIEVGRLTYITQAGQIIDIGPIAQEVSIFQDIFGHYLQCELVISDAQGFIESIKGIRDSNIQGGFNGGDILVVSYKTRDTELEFINHLFALYELSDRNRLDEKQETYIISGISYEAYITAPKRISRALGGNKGNTIANMISNMVNMELYNSVAKDFTRNYREITGVRVEKQVNLDSTNGLQRFIIPNLTIDETIDFLANEADCDAHVPFYTFYENSLGYNFKDFNNLVRQEVKEEFSYLPQNLPDQNSQENDNHKDFQRIMSYEVLKHTNVLENTTRGLFRSKTLNVDFLKKRHEEVIFNYDSEHEKFNKLQPNKIPANIEGEPVVNMFFSRKDHDCSCQVFGPENHLPKRLNLFSTRRRSYKNHLFNTVVNVTVPGNSDLNVGDLIYLHIPTPTTLSKRDGKDDKYLSGKYIITKLRQKFNSDTFTTFLECVKDTGIERP
jgi:hypothetical protein